MATSELAPPDVLLRDRTSAATRTGSLNLAFRALAALASLRLTVTLFALSIFLIFVGTLAQKDQDVWQVVNDTYFRVWFARVDLLAFERLAQMFFPGVKWELPYGFYFPGGKLLGFALLVNLFAAHYVRFKVAAAGKRLAIGLGVIVLGVLLTGLVIRNGMEQAVVSELPPAFFNNLWNVLRASLAGLAFTGAYILLVGYGHRRSVVWYVLLAVDLAIGALAVWLLMNPGFRIDDSGLRIVWQLLQGTAAGGVFLAGCVMVFRKRAGIVLLHSGVALLMISELWVAMTASESQMSIPEGGTVNYSNDVRSTELAVVNGAHEGHDHVTVVPESLLEENVGAAGPIESKDLPFQVRVLRWLPNARLREVTANDRNPANAGAGKQLTVDAVTPFTGVGDDAEKVDIPAAYVEFYDPTDQESLGTYLVSLELNDQPIDVNGHKYQVSLRFKRVYHPWSLTLKDFRFDRYTGTNTPKNYTSLVQLRDPAHNVDREVPISMNNPLRYAGTTLYQSGFDKSETGTVLQVVSNPSWMAPYVACMFVGLGMLAHFGVMIVRFLGRRADETISPHRGSASSHEGLTGHPIAAVSPWSLRAAWFPALIVLIFGTYVASKARMPHAPASEAQIYEFAKLPLAYEGRIKPYDSLARSTLQVLSGKTEVVGKQKPGLLARLFNRKERTPAMVWLMDVIAGTDNAADYPVFRLGNLELTETLGLKHREGLRYSLNEIFAKQGELQRQVELARQVSPEERSALQSKVAELYSKLNIYQLLVLSFQSPPISTDPEKMQASLGAVQKLIADLSANPSPHAVPPLDSTGKWTPLMTAEFQSLLAQATNRPVNPATQPLSSMLTAYARGDAAAFNKHLADYRTVLANYERSLESNLSQLKSDGVATSEILDISRVNFEVFYNQLSPFYYAAVLYVVAFVLGVLSWIGWTEPLRRASVWLLVLTLALHTAAVVGRIYISGRPPVTNLYSATIFFGWAGVLLALILERIYRLGLGNIAAAVVGFLTLVVANNLTLEGGDSFTVLQAVLDTQFWLATHVVTETLGYGATVLAGTFGALYILMARVFHVLDDDARRKLIRVTYGTLCFALFFSFIGTVLGGLWADDSWGRFWGWDPKENGALIIVLWNALVLHARWGGIVKNLGFAALNVGGNIAVAWSGFGVNEFGVGLHTYGASENNVAWWILVFVASQLAIIALALIPAEWFQRIGPRRTGLNS